MPTVLSIAVLAAIILGPILAIQIDRLLQARRETRHARLRVLRDLMATRGAKLSARHFEAVNALPAEFAGAGSVLRAWGQYVDHLNTQKPADLKAWEEKGRELLVALLVEIGVSAGCQLDLAAIKKEAILPTSVGEVDTELNQLRTVALEVVKGTRPFKVGGEEPKEEVQPLIREARPEIVKPIAEEDLPTTRMEAFKLAKPK